MTVISHKYKIIFIHIPKNAGSSVRYSILLNDPNAINSSHKSYIDLLKEYPIETKNYLIFTIVRNTYDRLVSLYHYIKTNLDQPHFNTDNYTTTFIKPFNECIKSLNFRLFADHVGQLSWIRDIENIIPRNINIFYHDSNFQEEINKLLFSNNINLILDIPKLNSSKHENYINYYDSELIEYVKKLFKDEIKYFNFNYYINII